MDNDFKSFNFSDISKLIEEYGNNQSNTSANQKAIFNIDEFIENSKIPVKYKNISNNPDPTYSHDGDSGFDLRAYIPDIESEYDELILNHMERALIRTGLYFELPEGYELEIRSRSGLAVKYGIGVLTGTVDNGYRGEVNVLLINFGSEPFKIENGDRIAQGVLIPRLSTEYARLEKVDSINETKRSTGGFGSTGTK